MSAGAKQSYAEQESLVNQQLAQLIRDAVWLKSYLAAVMRLSQEAFQLSHSALGPPQGAAQVSTTKRGRIHATAHLGGPRHYHTVIGEAAKLMADSLLAICSQTVCLVRA